MTFDYGTFSSNVEQLMSKLAELDGIDKCVGYLNDLTNRKAVVVAGPGQTILPESPAGLDVQVKLGTTYPFTMGAQINDGIVRQSGHPDQLDGTEALLHRDLAVLMNNAAGETDPYVIRFNITTTTIQYPTAANLAAISQAYTDDIVPPVHKLSSSNFAYLQDTLASWTGVAKDEFDDYVYTQITQIVANQAYLADCIGILVGGAKILVDLGQNSLDDIVTKALKAVDEQLKQRHDAHQSTSESAFDLLALGAAVTGFLGVVTLPVAPVSAVFTAGSVGLTYASTKVPPASEDAGEKIEARSAMDICNDLDRARERLLVHWQNHWDALHTQATHVQTLMATAETEHQLYPPVTELERHVPPTSHFGPS